MADGAGCGLGRWSDGVKVTLRPHLIIVCFFAVRSQRGRIARGRGGRPIELSDYRSWEIAPLPFVLPVPFLIVSGLAQIDTHAAQPYPEPTAA
jgi:hypothetical protein